MNINILIDSLVRQTTVLIAHLATAAGARAQLTSLANQVFVDLIRELKEQGLGNKVIADMFGLSLRNYHYKVRRLLESNTERGRTLWEAMLTYIQNHGPVSRGELLMRFSRDDEYTVRGILKDMIDSGIILRTGRGEEPSYRLPGSEENRAPAGDDGNGLANLVWVAVSNHGPVSRSQLLEHVPAGKKALDRALDKLLAEERISRVEAEGEPRYECRDCLIAMGDTAGWEAAVFDHYQAMVTALCAKLRSGARSATPGEWIGGSTYAFDVCAGHPYHDEVVGFLQATRDRASALRHRVEQYNADHALPEEGAMQVVAYVGQTVIDSNGPEEAGE
jgi:hypothetical protein